MLETEKTVQREKYKYPYHYIPYYGEHQFKQHEYWGTGHRYLGNIKIVLDELAKIKFASLIDIGCGDGRITGEIKKQYPQVKIRGMDYYEGAIDLAKAMNPDNKELFYVEDIFLSEKQETYDVVTMINVMEQIEVDLLDDFIKAAGDYLKKDGYLIATIPHDNKDVFGAAYQHFNENKLRNLLDCDYDNINFIYFDNIKSKKLKLFHFLIGGFQAKNWIITNKAINKNFFESYIKNYLYTDEYSCGRVAVICQKR